MQGSEGAVDNRVQRTRFSTDPKDLANVNAFKNHVWSLLLHKFNHNATKITKMFEHFYRPHSHYIANSCTHTHTIHFYKILISDRGRLSRFLYSLYQQFTSQSHWQLFFYSVSSALLFLQYPNLYYSCILLSWNSQLQTCACFCIDGRLS